MTTTSTFRDVIVRAIVTAEDLESAQAILEPCGMDIWISRTTLCSRYNIVGVPAKHVDVLVQHGLGDDDAVVLEIVRKTGKYDGAVRTRITFRRTCKGMQAVDGCRVSIDFDGPTCDVRVTREGDTLWSGQYDRLRAMAAPGGVRDIVMWHWSRFFQHLDAACAERVASEIVIEEGTTITAANRSVSNRLYEESVAIGWKKLTLREREKLGIAAEGAWQREDRVASLRAARAGYGSPTGCGEYTLKSANS